MPVRILERHPFPIPVRIEGTDRCKSRAPHSADRNVPISNLGIVENEQVIRSWSASSHVAVLLCELEVIWSAFSPQHYSIEPSVILKTAEYSQAKTIAVKPQEPIEVVTGTRDAKDRSIHGTHVHLKEAAVAGGLLHTRALTLQRVADQSAPPESAPPIPKS